VIECVPCDRVVVEYDALPLARVIGVPSCVAPSKNVTVPVIVPAVADITVAVNFTLCPDVAGFGVEVTAVVVVAFPDAFTVCKMPDELVS
jgi:hypothetical protein